MKKNFYNCIALTAAMMTGALAAAQSPGGVSANLRVWLKPDNGFAPAQWTDYSGNNNNYTQAYSSRQPFAAAASAAYNFNPVIDFGTTGADARFMVVPNGKPYTSNNSSSSIFVSVINRSATGYSDIIGFGSTTTTSSLWQANNPVFTRLTNDIVLYPYITSPGLPTQQSNTLFLSDVSFTFNTAGIKYGINGQAATVAATVTAGEAQHAAGSVLGSQPEERNGLIGEVIAYERDLSDPEKQRVRSYLAIKYGVSLPHNYTASNGSTVFWDVTANTGYDNNIAGIARDNGSALYQKQSKNIAAGQQVLIGLSTLANTNALNAGTLADGQFLTWGDNGLSRNPGIAISGIAGVSHRFAAIWKAQNTGSVGTVRIAWPVGLINLTLLQSSDATFDASDIQTPMSANTVVVNGVSYNYADVTLTNGQYFTFAAKVNAPGNVANGLTFWYDAGSGASITDWTDRKSAVQIVKNGTGTITLSGGDNTSNFNPYYVFPNGGGGTGAHFTGDLTTIAAGAYSPANLGRVHTTFAAGAKSGNIDGTYNHIFRFASIPGSTATHLFGLGTSGTNQPRLHYISGYNTTLNFDQSSVTVPLNTMSLYGAQLKTATYTPGNNSKVLRYNGTDAVISDGATADMNNNLQIGGDTYGFAGNIPEVIYYNQSLSDSDVQKVNTYMAIKYGITLSHNYMASNGTVAWNLATNTGYDKNIAGIARDDNGSLYQKQSRSILDSGEQVLIGLPALANTNMLNNGTLSNDLQFLIWGDNGLSRTPGVAITGITGINQRFSAIWKVQNTGNVGTVRVAWPAGLTNLRLIRSTDATFDASDTVTDMSTNTQVVNGVTYNYADVSLTDGQYFTFAAFIKAPGGVVANLTVWVRSDDAGNIATAWKDLSLNNNPVENIGGITLSAANSAHNFHPYTSGYSTTAFFRESNSPMTRYQTTPGVGATFGTWSRTSSSIFSAVRSASATGSGRITGIDNDIDFTSEPGISINTGKPYQYEFFETTTFGSHSTSFGLNQSAVFSAVQDQTLGVGGGQRRLGLNGAYETANAPAGNFYHLIGPYMNIGYGDFDVNGAFPGDIMEVVWYDRALSQNEQSRVNSYLAIKNGATLAENYLSSTSNDIWDITANTGYNSNIAGIGRDDADDLYQKQSNSINADIDGQVVIGLGTIAASNAANTSSLNDGQFMLWGDNGNTQTLTAASTVFTYNGYTNNRRMNRVWKVQNLGITQMLKIQFPVTSVGTTTLAGEGSCAKYVLIASADPTFASGVTSYVLTTNGSNYEISRKIPAGASFFTFAKVNEIPNGAAYLPLADSTVPYTDPCLLAGGWKYYYYDAAKTKRAFAINWNGNTEPGTLNGVLTYNQSHYTVTAGAFTTNIMGRLMEILPAGGSYLVNGGVKVKIFFDSSELNSSLAPNFTSAKWFKYPGNAASVQAANNGQTITNAQFLIPSTSGEEDGIDYVQFDNIGSFSTFGFASSNFVVPLPLELLGFDAYLQQNNTVKLSWQIAQPASFSVFYPERSNDSKSWTQLAAIKSTGEASYQYTDATCLTGQNFYRLKISHPDNKIIYSAVRVISGAKGTNIYQVYPNPAMDAVTIAWNAEYMKPVQVRLITIQGQSIAVNAGYTDNKILLDLKNIQPGIYYLLIRRNDGSNFSTPVTRK